MVRKALILLIATALFLQTGCWDYKEIVSKIIISGIAVDYDTETEGIILTVEIVLPGSSAKESSFKSHIYQGKGKDILDAETDLMTRAGHKLLWSHAKILIISEDLLEKKDLLIGTMDWIKREYETRDYIWMTLSKDKTASEILEKSDSQTEDIVSYYLDHLFLTIRDNETYIKVPYWSFMNDMGSESACAVLPTVSLKDSSSGTLPYLSGTEILNNGKPIYWLGSSQTKILLLLKNQLHKGIFLQEQEKNGKKQTVALAVLNSKVTIKPIIINDYTLNMKINVQMEANIGEIDGDIEIFTPDDLKKLENDAGNMITNQINNLINTLKEKYKCDVIGFGDIVAKKYPKLWEKIKGDWETEFAKIPTIIQVKLKITGSEQSMKTTKAGK